MSLIIEGKFMREYCKIPVIIEFQVWNVYGTLCYENYRIVL